MTSYENAESVRLHLIADASGAIVAAVVPVVSESTTSDGPTQFGIVPSADQTVHEILLPDEPQRTDILNSLGSYRVIVDGAEPKLEKLPPQTSD